MTQRTEITSAMVARGINLWFGKTTWTIGNDIPTMYAPKPIESVNDPQRKPKD